MPTNANSVQNVQGLTKTETRRQMFKINFITENSSEKGPPAGSSLRMLSHLYIKSTCRDAQRGATRCPSGSARRHRVSSFLR